MSEIRANTIANAAGTGPADLTGQWAAKAWVRFDATGTLSIDASENVASITDNGAGSYSINLSNAFAAATDYGAVAMSQIDLGTNVNAVRSLADTSSVIDYFNRSADPDDSSASAVDTDENVCVAFGDLA